MYGLLYLAPLSMLALSKVFGIYDFQYNAADFELSAYALVASTLLPPIAGGLVWLVIFLKRQIF